MKQIKTREIATVNALLKGAKMTNGDTAAKIALVKAIIATNAVAEKFNELEKTTREKLQPADYKAMQTKAQRIKELPIDEFVELNKKFDKFEREVQDALKEAGADETRVVDLTPWTQEQVDALISSNDFNGATMLFLHQVLLEEKKPETDKKA